MTPALFLAGMAALCAVLCVGAVRAWRVLEARPLRPLEAWVGRLAAVAVMALPLLADAGALPGPRAPSVGLPLTGGTMTGQVVFSGVTTDVSTGTNENFTVAPNGTGYFEIAMTGGSAVAETLYRFTVSDVTTTKFFAALENGTSTNAIMLPVFYGITNSTTATHAGFTAYGVVPDGADVATNTGTIVSGGAESTDGYTGTWSALENRPIHSFRNFDTDKLHVGPQGQLRQPGYLTALPTCDSTTVATQTFYNKAAANKISHCVCVMTAAATYAWETSHASGDCT